jgi:hypothetical protein
MRITRSGTIGVSPRSMQIKVIAMTATTTQTTPPRSRFTRWVTAQFRALWHAQAELAAAGGGYFLV